MSCAYGTTSFIDSPRERSSGSTGIYYWISTRLNVFQGVILIWVRDKRSPLSSLGRINNTLHVDQFHPLLIFQDIIKSTLLGHHQLPHLLHKTILSGLPIIILLYHSLSMRINYQTSQLWGLIYASLLGQFITVCRYLSVMDFYFLEHPNKCFC